MGRSTFESRGLQRTPIRCALCAVMALVLNACGGVDDLGFLTPADAGTGGAGGGGGSSHSLTQADASAGGAGSTADGSDAAISGSAGQGGGGEPGMLSHDALCAPTPVGMPACDPTRAVFARALCTCADMSGTGSLTVASLDGTRPANVGVNGVFSLRLDQRALSTTSAGGVAGDLVIASTSITPLSGAAPLIAGDLKVGGSLAFASNVHVQGSTWSHEQPAGNGTLRIDGDLHHSALRPMPPNVFVAGSEVVEAYSTAAPCTCGAQQPLDIAQVVAHGASDNDDAAAKLTPDALVNAPATRELDCGRYYLDAVSAPGDLTLTLSGRTAIYVASDFTVHGDLDVVLQPGAELDLWIGGSLSIGGAARFGDPSRPSAARVYVAGSVAFSVMPDKPVFPKPTSASGDAVLVGNLYAPKATLQLSPHTDVYGALFTQSLVVLQSLQMHYDPAVAAAAGGGCGG